MKPTIVFSFLFCILSLPMTAQLKTNPNNQNEELGKVSWNRDYDDALAQASREKKSVLILFQEVPGCGTCKNYGHEVLTHPLMVEAIENEFIPLVVFNNKGADDRKVLNLYGEPTWNNPVVRIVDEKGKNIINRVAGEYTALGLFEAMATALIKQQKSMPGYMKVLGEELRAEKSGTTQEAYYKMYCFWSGEGHLGRAEGVVATEPGFLSGHEVVKVKYDVSITSAESLDNYAGQAGCAPISSSKTFRPDKDPQYYLKQTPLKYLPLTDLQKSRINSAIGKRESPEEFLSPKQKDWLAAVKKGSGKDVLYTQEFEAAWRKLDN